MIAPIFVAIAGLASLTAAQSGGIGVGNQTVIPGSVDLNTRNGWCRAQQNTCNTLCNKNWSTNDCTTDPLEADCVCADGSKPNLAIYTDTLPFFVCQAYIGQCVEGNATLPVLQEVCRSTNTCGNQDPTKVTFSTTMKSSTSGPSPTKSGTSTGTDAPAETTGTNGPSTTPNAGMIVQPASASLLAVTALIGSMVLAGFGLVL